MENKTTNVEDVFYKFKDYADTRIDLFKLKSISKVSGILSSIISGILLILLLFLILICITIGFSLLIGNALGNAFIGFFIMAFIYIIIGLILFFSRSKLIKTPISNKFIREFMD
ncbi:MAG: hypothetical protein ABIN48_05795 [Ginsengibacter sp.]